MYEIAFRKEPTWPDILGTMMSHAPIEPSLDLALESNVADSECENDHGERPLENGEYARIWRHKSLREIDLFRGSYKRHRFARHFHRIPVIGVIDHGVMSSYCRRRHYTIETDTIVLLNAGEIHAPEPGAESGWGMRMFFLNESFVRSLWPNLKAEELRFKEPFVQDPILASLLVRLHLALERPGDRLAFDQLFAQVGEALMERYVVSAPSGAEPDSTANSINRVLEFVEANCHRNLSLADLAQMSPYGPSHFLRRFKESVGLTPHAYLTQVRVEWASAQLRSGKAIADVASTLGFTDQSHLTRQFKRMFGITPGQYAASLA